MFGGLGGRDMGSEMSRREAILAAGAGAAGLPGPGPVGGGGVPELAGKTVVVYTRIRPLAQGAVLSQCRFEWQGDRLFLAGLRQPCARQVPSWTDGVPCYIAWEAVEEYMVFSSAADYQARLRDPDPAVESVGES